jgi:hypothetical protein
MRISIAMLAGYARYARKIKDTFPISKRPCSRTKKTLEWFDALPEQQRRECLIAADSLSTFVEMLLREAGDVNINVCEESKQGESDASLESSVVIPRNSDFDGRF